MPSERSIDLIAQLQAHLHSLRAAGILLVPRGRPLELGSPQEVRSIAPGEPNPSTLVQFRPSTPAPGLALASHPAAAPNTPEGRRHSLQLLAQEVGNCDLCGELSATRTQTVFGTGPVDPEVAFAGEAPGADEDREGQPFIGRAGQLLTRIITRCGFSRPDVYIFNTLKCRPPNNRQPSGDECSNCRPYFERQFDLVAPKYVVALGLTAARNMLQTTESLRALRGRMHEYRGRPLLVTYHPSALLRDHSKQMWWDCWEDMKLLLKTMGRLIPEEK